MFYVIILNEWIFKAFKSEFMLYYFCLRTVSSWYLVRSYGSIVVTHYYFWQCTAFKFIVIDIKSFLEFLFIYLLIKET